jgi:hypothetical protein
MLLDSQKRVFTWHEATRAISNSTNSIDSISLALASEACFRDVALLEIEAHVHRSKQRPLAEDPSLRPLDRIG